MSQVWTITSLLIWTADYLKKHQIESPRLEAELLLAYTLKLKRLDLFIKHDQIVTAEELSLFKRIIQRKVNQEPTAYITSSQPFMGLDFHVDKNVLIPRPETEQMVELAIDLIKRSTHHEPQFIIADIGTGSGCIAVSLAKYLPNVKVIGIDASSQAIEIAKKNALRHKTADRCELIIGNLLEPLEQPVDLIISNPPYIPTADIETLEANVSDFEPRQALDGGADGLDYIRQIIEQSPKHLKPDGYLIIEFGWGQAEEIKSLVKDTFHDIKIIRDLAKKDRFLLAKLN